MNRDEKHYGLFMSDVWGKYDDNHNKVSTGMIVARGIPYDKNSPEGKDLIEKTGYPAVCPVFGDVLPYKSVTVVCTEEHFNAVTYWLSFVHGGQHYGEKKLKDGRIALRSNYQCW